MRKARMLVLLLAMSVFSNCNCSCEDDLLVNVVCGDCNNPPLPVCEDESTLVRWEKVGQCSDERPDLCEYKKITENCPEGCDSSTVACRQAIPPLDSGITEDDAGFLDAYVSDSGVLSPDVGFEDTGVLSDTGLFDTGVSTQEDSGPSVPDSGVQLPCNQANNLAANQIRLTSHSANENQPFVSAGVSSLLATWIDRRDGSDGDAYGSIVSVSSSGTLMAGQDIRIGSDALTSVNTNSVFTGNQWLVSWYSTVPNTGPGDAINVNSVSLTGVVGAARVVSSPSARGAGGQVMAFNGNVVSVIWADSRGTTTMNSDLYGVCLSPSGAIICSERRLFPQSSFPTRDRPAIDWNQVAGVFDLTWQEGTNPSTVRYGGLNMSNNFVVQATTSVVASAGITVGIPNHVSLPGGPLVTWISGLPPDYSPTIGRLNTAGTLQGGSTAIAAARMSGNRVALAGTGNRFGVLYQSIGRNGTIDLFFAEVDQNGNVITPPAQMTNALGASSNPHMAYFRGRYVAIWEDSRNGSTDIYMSVGTCVL